MYKEESFMFDYMKSLFKRKKCAICGKNAEKPANYYDDKGEKVVVCFQCVPYAERRAFRKR